MSPTITQAAPRKMARGSTRKADRTGSRHIDNRTWTDACRYGAVIAGREDVGQQSEIADLGHCLIAIRKFQQVEIGVGNHDIFGLPADPAAHIDISVSRARPRRIHIQTNAGSAFLTVPATAASDVERHGTQVAFLDEFDIAAGFDDLRQ